MLPGTLDRRPPSTRPRLTALAAVLVLTAALLAAHGAVAGGHMSAGMGKAMTVCLAVMQGAVVVQGLRGIRRARTRRAAPRYPLPWVPTVARAVLPDLVPGRPGPARSGSRSSVSESRTQLHRGPSTRTRKAHRT